MRGVQRPSEKAQADRFHPLSVRMGMARTLKLVARLYWFKTQNKDDVKD